MSPGVQLRRCNLHCSKGAEVGAELTISYLDLLQFPTRQERQLYLQDQFTFTCTCSLCSLPPNLQEEDDAVRRKVMGFKYWQLIGTNQDEKNKIFPTALQFAGCLPDR